MENSDDAVIKVNLAGLIDAIYDSVSTAALGEFPVALAELGDIDEAYASACAGNDDAYEYLFEQARELGINPDAYCS